ncbi:hypothetical protein CR513_53179, partial [Mucuna pruriens]
LTKFAHIILVNIKYSFEKLPSLYIQKIEILKSHSKVSWYGSTEVSTFGAEVSHATFALPDGEATTTSFPFKAPREPVIPCPSHAPTIVTTTNS